MTEIKQHQIWRRNNGVFVYVATRNPLWCHVINTDATLEGGFPGDPRNPLWCQAINKDATLEDSSLGDQQEPADLMPTLQVGQKWHFEGCPSSYVSGHTFQINEVYGHLPSAQVLARRGLTSSPRLGGTLLVDCIINFYRYATLVTEEEAPRARGKHRRSECPSCTLSTYNRSGWIGMAYGPDAPCLDCVED